MIVKLTGLGGGNQHVFGQFITDLYKNGIIVCRQVREETKKNCAAGCKIFNKLIHSYAS